MARLSWTALLVAALANTGAGLSIARGLPRPTWKLLPTGTTARFRGLAPVSDKIAWVSGLGGTVLRTTDGGLTWASVGPAPSESDNTTALDFRDIEAWSADKAIILSIGEGNSSRVYVTGDGGASWTRSFTNEEDAAFYDCIAFESPERGMAMSDPVDGKIRLIETLDGGQSWNIVESAGMVPAEDGEAGFAASGTCLATTAGRWYVAAGGVNPSRIFRSGDGYTWDVSDAAIAGGEGAGVFSVQFRDAEHGIAVGGNYSDPTGNINNAAWTKDGGVTWLPATAFPDGYRSGSAWVPGRGFCNTALAVGPSGSDFTLDGGKFWHRFDNGSFDSVECVEGPVCWASGEKGRVARLVLT
ncbi:oxidoreductase [Hypoxylon rubiginosum]|uniref:Oxidoreductase n=1 Tax=Hypoxylon rubiginosum TaxID=110542 RepID=A0ACC0CIX0_9PEZI|nr:oxidoreductase [Hypoxylon rubiginosum]